MNIYLLITLFVYAVSLYSVLKSEGHCILGPTSPKSGDMSLCPSVSCTPDNKEYMMMMTMAHVCMCQIFTRGFLSLVSDSLSKVLILPTVLNVTKVSYFVKL